MPKKSSKKSKKDVKEEPLKEEKTSKECLLENTIKNDDESFGNKTDLEAEKHIIDNVVSKEERITKDRLTRYEMVRIISERTKQLTMGAKPLIKNHSSLTYEQIAIEEIKHNMVPYRIRRPINNKYEIWDLDELKKDHLSAYLK
jgi:DNA-directed RNA polymerase subunit K/omega